MTRIRLVVRKRNLMFTGKLPVKRTPLSALTQAHKNACYGSCTGSYEAAYARANYLVGRITMVPI